MAHGTHGLNVTILQKINVYRLKQLKPLKTFLAYPALGLPGPAMRRQAWQSPGEQTLSIPDAAKPGGAGLGTTSRERHGGKGQEIGQNSNVWAILRPCKARAEWRSG